MVLRQLLSIGPIICDLLGKTQYGFQYKILKHAWETDVWHKERSKERDILS